MTKVMLPAALLLLFPLGARATGEPKAQAAPKAQLAPKTKQGSTAWAKFRVPLFSDQFANFPAAAVGDEVVTLRQLVAAIALNHEEHGAEKAADKNFEAVLARLVDLRLIVFEARSMGMDELPDVKKAVADFRASTLREVVKRRVTLNVQPDKEEVERLYKEAVREWKIRSALFEKEEDAKAFAAELKAGKSFDQVAKEAVAAKKGKVGEPEFQGAAGLLPEVLKAIIPLQAGGFTDALRVQGGWALVAVQEIRYQDNLAAREAAERESRGRQKAKSLKKYFADLSAQNAKTDRKLLASLNFAAKSPGLAKLKTDRRVVSAIKGDKPLTVGDLATELEQKYYHGISAAIRDNTVEADKQEVFELLLARRLFTQQAEQLRIAETPEYKEEIADFENTLLFSTFIDRVVRPEVKATESELQSYYEKNKGKYSYPTFYRIHSLGFAKQKDAQTALGKLRAGADFKWVKQNAEGQLKLEDRKLELGGELVAEKNLGDELAKVVSGAKTGDLRLHAEKGGQTYVLQIREVVPAKAKPYLEVRQEIGDAVYQQKLSNSLKSWTSKLRQAHEVKVYVNSIEI